MSDKDKVVLELIACCLKDGVFELQFLEAIPVGADFSLVWPRFAVWLLTDPKNGVLQHSKDTRQAKAIKEVAELYQEILNGREVTKDRFEDAAFSADTIYNYRDWALFTAESAANAYVGSAIYSAVMACPLQERNGAHIAQRDKLLELLREAPV